MLKYGVTINTLTKMEQMMIEKFVSFITNTIDIEAIYLFGSRAKVEGHKESDIDIAIIVKNKEAIKEITRRVIESSIKVEEDLDVSGKLMLSPIVIDESLLKTTFGIGKSVREEGILLWSKKPGQKRKVI
jgi:predicted nucleotidyltransferase